MNITNFDLTKGFGSRRKCWYMTCMVDAIAHAGGKTRDELLNELEGRTPSENIMRVEHNGQIFTEEEINRTHNVSQPEGHWPGDGERDSISSDYTFAPGA